MRVRAAKKLSKKARNSEVVEIGDKRPHLTVQINGEAVRGLLDSGASISCVGANAMKTVQRCKLSWKENGGAIQTASGQQQQVKGFADAMVEFRGVTKLIRLYIIPSLSQEMYLGVDFWLAFNLLPKLEEVAPLEPAATNVHILDANQKARLDHIVKQFPSSEVEGLGKTSLSKHVINVGDARPTKQRYHAVSPAIEQKMFGEVDRMLSLGVIKESMSAWNSPVTIVAKANGKSR